MDGYNKYVIVYAKYIQELCKAIGKMYTIRGRYNVDAAICRKNWQ